MTVQLPSTDEPFLVGRNDALAALHRFINTGATSGGSLLLIGPPGVGKTALLNAVVASAQDRARVVRAAGVEFEADISFAGLHQVLLPLFDHLTELTDHHQAALSVALGMSEGAPAGRLVVAAAALALLRSATADQPLMIVVDDLTWLDRPSSQVLGFIARRLEGTRVAKIEPTSHQV